MIFVESEICELKREVTADIIKEVVAFANSKGGTIFIGVEDQGDVAGVDDFQRGIEKLSSMIIDKIKPSVLSYCQIRSRIIENYDITYETTRSLEQALTFKYAADEFTSRGLAFSDSQMTTLGLVNEVGLYTNLALLLSDQCPHVIKAAVFMGDDKTEFKTRQEFGGSLLKQLNDVYRFIQIQNNVHSTYEGLRRVDQYDYNDMAIREALINAIVHRDYGVSGSVFVNMYLNHVEFVSLGSLPLGIELADIMEGVSKARNEKLAGVFYRLELIEAYGTGIMKIMNAYKDTGYRPEFVATPNAFIVRLPKMIKEAGLFHENEAVYAPGIKGEKSNPLNRLDSEAVKGHIIKSMQEMGMITRKTVQENYGFSQTKSGALLRELEDAGRVRKCGNGRTVFYVLNCK